MGRRVAGVCSVLCALLLVAWLVVSAARGGSSPTTTATPGAAASAWPAPPDVLSGQLQPPWSLLPAGAALASTESALGPTGIELVNAPGVESMVVDGTGAVWLHSPWQLTRVDPTTGAAQSWDVADDAVFATMGSIEPTAGAGVWLVESDRVRLFDGRSFVRDLSVPAQYRGGEGRRITGLVEVGSEVWVSSAAGVARSAGGPWTMVGDDTIDGAAMPTIDADGRMWAVSQLLRSDGVLEQTVVRFDGARWTAVDGPDAPTFAEQLVADPTGGLLVRFGLDIRRFDGQSWRPMAQLSSAQRLGTPATLDMSVAPDGTVWLVGPEGMARGGGSQPWQSLVQVDEPTLVGVGIVGDGVLVADSSGLLRLDGDQLSRVWSAPDRGLGSPMSGLLVVSSDEVWATGEGAIHQYVEGRWQPRREGLGWLGGPRMGWGVESGLALASDGAVWAITGGALARFDGDEPVVIPRNLADGWLLAGPGAGVWAVEAIWPGWSRWYAGEDPDGSSVTLVRTDGTQMSVRLPGPPWSLTSLAAGVDGSIWVTICEEERADYCTVPTLMRWDGQWASVPYPGAGLKGVSVAADGAFWALITAGTSAEEQPVVARYADGSWTRFTQAADRDSVSPSPSGGVCGVDADDSTLVCLDPAGRASSRALPVPGHVQIGPDGSLWVQDSGVVARLPGTAPG